MERESSSNWKKIKNSKLIKDKILEIGDGYRAKNSELNFPGLPFARAGNIKDGFHFSSPDILEEKSVIKAGKKISKINDVVLTTKGTFRRVAFVTKDTEQFVYCSQLYYWRVLDPSILNPRFLYDSGYESDRIAADSNISNLGKYLIVCKCYTDFNRHDTFCFGGRKKRR